MTGLYLSRVSLREDPSVAALAAALMPTGSDSLNTDHRAVWSLFADPAAERDFLWRKEEGRGRYMILSRRQPDRASPIFQVQTRPFEVNLAPSDRLAFHLRVNATVARKSGPGRGKRHDVAMDLLRAHPPGDRAAYRDALAERAAREWLVAQASGFDLEAVVLDRYDIHELPRRGRPARLGIFDLSGRLRVTDPEAFVGRLARGYGRGKAFGCGLMLIRRA